MAALVLPSAASAYPGERPADGQLWEEATIARDYWAARGFDSCEHVAPSFAPYPGHAEEAEGWAGIGSCAFALTPQFASESRQMTSYFGLRSECATVVHEYGHALGGRRVGIDAR